MVYIPAVDIRVSYSLLLFLFSYYCWYIYQCYIYHIYLLLVYISAIYIPSVDIYGIYNTGIYTGIILFASLSFLLLSILWYIYRPLCNMVYIPRYIIDILFPSLPFLFSYFSVSWEEN